MSTWTCPACYRIAELPDGLPMALCDDGHDRLFMRRLVTRPQTAEEVFAARVAPASECDSAGVCMYDRYCPFYHEACRFDSVRPSLS